MKELTEKTLVPISLVIVLSGALFWISAMWVKTEANSKNIEELKTTTETYLRSIDQRLSRIEGRLEKVR